MSALREQGMTDLIFDLRNNPGGQLEAATGIANFFLREGQLIVSTAAARPTAFRP